jgi:AcrR family transcriptional regulator
MTKPRDTAAPPTAAQPRRGRDEAIRLAKRRYLDGQKIDISAIAQEMGVNRVTLHRWVGTKDSLLVEVIWSLTERSLSQAWEELRDTPGPRVPKALGRHLRATLEQPGARQIALQHDEHFMRLMTLSSYGYHPRLVALIRGYIAEDLAGHRVHSSLSLDDLAYATVRIADSYHYLPTITGQLPDPEGAERVLGELLRP